MFNTLPAVREVTINPTTTTPEGSMEEAYPTGSMQEQPGKKLTFVNYHTELRPRSYMTSKRFILTVLANALLATLLIVTAVSIRSRDSSSSSSNNNDGISLAEKLRIRSKVETVVDASLLEDDQSAYYKALQWITYNDQYLQPDESKLLQRYALVYFYFATSEAQEWTTCGRATNGQTEICRSSLWTWIVGEENLIEDVAQDEIRWLSSYDECMWAGVHCDGLNQVNKIILENVGVNGPFPEDIRLMPFLQHLQLDFGGLHGAFPEHKVAALKHLNRLGLRGNELTGTLPAVWDTSYNLGNLMLQGNSLEGTIPSAVGGLRDLKHLSLHRNDLEGEIPDIFRDAANLAGLELSYNRLNGTIPTFWYSLRQNVRELFLDNNQFTGAIPSEIGLLSNLVWLRLGSNRLSAGPIPDEFWNLRNINIMDLSDCNLTGTLSPRVDQMANLTSLHLMNNHLSGQIPTVWDNVAKLNSLILSGNDFVGTMPPELCSRRSDKPWAFSELVADCLLNRVEGFTPAEITCSDDCCTRCCDANGENCRNTDGSF